MTNIFKLRMNKMHTILMKTKLPSDLFHIYLLSELMISIIYKSVTSDQSYIKSECFLQPW